MPACLTRLRPAVQRVSLHVDLDVLDPTTGRASAWANGPGLSRRQLLDVVRAVAAEYPIAALTLSAYDPSFDFDHSVRETALAVVDAIRSIRG